MIAWQIQASEFHLDVWNKTYGLKRFVVPFLVALSGLASAQVMGGFGYSRLTRAAKSKPVHSRVHHPSHKLTLTAPVPKLDSNAADLARERLQIEAAHNDLAAAEARADAYREQIDALRQTASDARASAQESRFIVLAVLTLTPLLVAVILIVQALRNSQENKRKLQQALEKDLFPKIKENAAALVTSATADIDLEIEEVRDYLDRIVSEVKRDRVASLDGLRLFFYRQAYDFKTRGAWGRAMMFTVYALVAEFEAAELTGEEARLRYARVAMANHGGLLIEH